MNVVLATPEPSGVRRGNRVTAERWRQRFEELGHEAAVVAEWRGEACDALVALHARRSLPSIERYAGRPGRGALIVAATGTDLYGDLPAGDAAALRGVRLADRIVVLQPAAVAALPGEVRQRAVVILQSAELPPGFSAAAHAGPDTGELRIAVLSHLRGVKDPLCAARAARRLPASSRIRVVLAGAALEADLAVEARREEAANPRFRWLGELTREEALAMLAGSAALALTSLLEGGANVVSEAVTLGIPVLASEIPGTVGLLGEEYPGYFPAGDVEALAALLWRVEGEPALLADLAARCRRLAPRFAPEAERQAWHRLLRGVTPRSPGEPARR